MTNQENTGLEIVDLVAYKAARSEKTNESNNEVITDVHFSVTRGGAIVPGSVRVAELHVLTVLAWCLDVSNNMLDAYLHKPH
jgi:hypothetical protein